VEDLWQRKRAEIDRGDHLALIGKGGVSFVQAVSRFYDWLDYRVKQGQPKPLSPVTANDYQRTLAEVARIIGTDFPIESIGQDQFEQIAMAYRDCAPATLSRVVAYVKSFFAFCLRESLISATPPYGSYFAKPPQQSRRDKRISESRSYSPAQLRRIWSHAGPEERCWMALAINGALDNADIAGLTWEVLDLRAGILDYRRRKVGRIRRVIPLRPEVVEMLRGLPPRRSDRVFLTPTGLPLQRLVTSPATGRTNHIDYLHMMWTRLMIRSGLRPDFPKPGGVRRFRSRGSAAGQGFRSIRTTFANLAPVAYRNELEVIMGHTGGRVLDEHYLEDGLGRLRELVDHVWHSVFPPTVSTSP
jgi:integrase